MHMKQSEKEGQIVRGHPVSVSASPRKPDGIAASCVVVVTTDHKSETQKDPQT